MVMIAGHVGTFITSIRQGAKSLAPILILLVYTLIGALIFMAIEGPNERYEMEQLAAQRQKLLEDTAFRLNTIKSMTPIQAYNHTVGTLNNYRQKLGVGDVNFNETKWNIWGSIYFSMTVYTTIGYGNITPSTTTGRILTIIYAFIGIPLALISLIALGSFFARICLYIWRFIARSLGYFSKDLERKMTIAAEVDSTEGDGTNAIETGQPIKRQSERSSVERSSDDKTEELLEFPVAFLIGVTIIWIFLCAWIFLLWEDTWNYWLSLYFVLISFTTIGFGDVTPSKYKYMIPVCLMLLIGLALVSTVLTIIQKQINALADNMKDTIDKDYRQALQELGEEESRSSIEPIDGVTKNGKYGKTVRISPGKNDKRTLDAVISRMPLRSRILYHIMPSDRRKQLAKHVNRRQNIGAKWVQTDPWLLETLLPTADQNPNF